ncbi:hypothetical protein DSCW_60160 [Desulfosarcina widdelii]|uniref:HTH iclR-type domain-containing protein n=1 Tax=Desulfosarcina widdelii TaxID=947919 RepID=A0A5K7ZEL9_9BACT|nr:helix-turn-helix domain-containing protein [Desulfosarcina widdelii]BBO78599.1 hypothetical protein DSCW_60160 [Desulfosarcina widdelii]
MAKTFAQQIRDIMRIDLKDRETFTYDDIALRLDMVSGGERRRLYKAMLDFLKRGEVVRIKPGLLSYRDREYEVRPADKTRCMFKLIRANRSGSVTINDLVANCRVTKSTAREYLRVLVKRGVLRRIERPGLAPAKFMMIHDPGPNLLRNEANAEKLKRLREAKALAEEALSSVRESLDRAVAAVAAIEEE